MAGQPQRAGADFWRVSDFGPKPARSGQAHHLLAPHRELRRDGSPSVEILEAHAAAFYGLAAKRLPPESVAAINVHTREASPRRQLLTSDILARPVKRLPSDAYCLIGITMEDLYPDESWNYVFGYASFKERVGVYSFARYDPQFFGEARGADYERVILQRSMKVMTHELGHMFGMAHCVHYSCNMNGSNHLDEADAQPLHLCPVCLRKLQWSTPFDPQDRYGALGQIYTQQGLGDESAWIDRRVTYIADATDSPASP